MLIHKTCFLGLLQLLYGMCMAIPFYININSIRILYCGERNVNHSTNDLISDVLFGLGNFIHPSNLTSVVSDSI